MKVTLGPSLDSVQIPPYQLHDAIDEWLLPSQGFKPVTRYEIKQRQELNFLIKSFVFKQGWTPQALLDGIVKVIKQHTPHMVVLHQPLAYGLKLQPPYGFPLPFADHKYSLHEVVDRTVKIVNRLKFEGVLVAISEVCPQVEYDSIQYLLNCCNTSISRFILYWDFQSHATQLELSNLVNKLKLYCLELQIELAVALTDHPYYPSITGPLSTTDFESSVKQQWRLFRQCSQFDRVMLLAKENPSRKNTPSTASLISLAEEILTYK